MGQVSRRKLPKAWMEPRAEDQEISYECLESTLKRFPGIDSKHSFFSRFSHLV